MPRWRYGNRVATADPSEEEYLDTGIAFHHLVYPLPEPGGLAIRLTLDLGGQARLGPDVEWVDNIDYSVDPGRPRRSYAAFRKIAAWILLSVVIVLSLVPPSFRPTTVIPHVFEHLIIFFLIGVAFGLGHARAESF